MPIGFIIRNENHNSIVRRYIPKGVSLNDISDDEIFDNENRINNMPRKILSFDSSDFLFEKELDKIYKLKVA